MKKSGPLKRRTPLRPKTRYGNSTINPKPSKKQAAVNRERAAWNKRLRAGEIDCEAQVPGVCDDSRKARDWHERLRRSAQGSATDPANRVNLCRQCHDYVHANIAWAVEQGFLERKFVAE